MANFLDNLSSYNAKAALAISNAVAAGDTQKANMMSSLKSTANDETLSEAVRLNALTALVNLGSLLEIPLPPYFPMSVQYADIQTYEGVHNDLLGIQGGAPNEYYHLTFAERAAIASAASLSDITWANLLGSYTDNNTFAALFDAKQAALSAPVGDHFVKINGTTISYDNSVYLTSSTGLASGSAAGGDLGGTYPNPTVLNSAVISKLLVGWNGSASNVPVTSSDSILTGMQKLNARINDIVANPGGVSSVALSTNAPAIFDGTSAQTGAATVTLGLRNQNANLFLASSSTLPNTQPTFRAIDVADLPTASAVTPAQYGSTSLIPQITVDSKGRITAITNVTAAAGGQVNSVTLSVPSGSIYSSNATGTATDPILNFSVQSQAPNTVYAGPDSGVSNVVPSFRALVAADIASISIPQSQVTGLADTLSTFMTNSLANSTMYVGNGSDAAVAGTVSGDLEMAYVDNNGTDEASFTIKDGVVTYDKIQDVTSGKVLGRYSTIDGPPQHLTFDSTAFTLNTTSGVIGLQTPNPSLLTNKGDILTRGASAPTRLGIGANATLFMADSAATTGNKWVAMSGDATIAASGALTIANSAVTLGKMANLAANSIIGNNTGSSDTPIALTATQATAMLDLFSTTTTAKGLVQGSNGADNTHFLRADNTWQPITGTGTVTSGGDKELAYYDSAGTTVQGLAVSPSNGTFILSQTITSGTPANPAWTAVTGTGDVVLATSPTIDTSFTATYATSDTLAQFDVSKNLVSATTGVGVITALGVPVGTAGAFVVNGGALGSPASGNFTTGTFTWPTFNQNTSGSAASLTTSRDIQTNLGSTSAAAFNGTANITPGVTGTLPVGNGGTGAPSLTAFAVLCGGTTATGAVQSIVSVGTAGQVLTSNGAGALPTFQTGGGSVALNSVLASTASATISHGNFTNTWNWNSNTTSNAFVFGSTSITTAALLAVSHTTSAYTGGGIVSFSSTGITSGNLLALGISGSTATSAENLVITNSSTANTSGRGLDISITEATASGNTFGAFISNTKTGATSTNTAISLTASGGTTNYALDVVAGISRFAAGTATTPQLILTPSTAAGGTTFTGTVNGSIWYDTNSSGTATSAFSVYKDTSITRLVTVARNPDFATTGSGVVLADSVGTLSKGADLTALGIFAQTSTVTVANTATSTTLIGTVTGVTTLPANFFGVGKTIKVFVSGTYNQASGSQDCALKLTIGGVAVGTITFNHNGGLTTVYYDAEFTLTCRTAGASGTLQFMGLGRLNHTTNDLLNFFQVSTTSLAINTTGTLAIDLQADWVTADNANSITASILTATYLN